MKAAVADRLALYVNPIFEQSSKVSGMQALLAMVFFMLQIYADFSGYSNMALGSARLFGIKLMVNFRQPYLASSLSDFWRRWHISLSTWFRDYLYIPLGGNRKGILRSSINLLVVFLISGLWHGAGWNFLLWGFLHGLGLVLENRFFPQKSADFSFLRWFLTQSWVLFCWVFFRAVSMENAVQMFQAMWHWEQPGILLEFSNSEILYGLVLALAIPVAEHLNLQEKAFRKWPGISSALLFLAAYFLGNFKTSSFLYFQF
jgi:D-alanyl-lipoteichoic acid acyltransferase DltB (MBOAT superfamily)